MIIFTVFYLLYIKDLESTWQQWLFSWNDGLSDVVSIFSSVNDEYQHI